jgi:hypothetical protein
VCPQATDYMIDMQLYYEYSSVLRHASEQGSVDHSAKLNIIIVMLDRAR